MSRHAARPHAQPIALRSALITFVILGVFLMPLFGAAQGVQKIFRVGHLAAPGRTPDGAPPRPLREALRALGYVEGHNIAYEARFAEGNFDRLPELAAELVRLKVDVIVAQGGASARSTSASAKAPTTVPLGSRVELPRFGGG